AFDSILRGPVVPATFRVGRPCPGAASAAGKGHDMPYNLQVIHAGDFLRAGAHGRPDLESSRRALAKVAQAMIARGLDRVLLDLRNVAGSGLTSTELFTLATTFHEAGFRQEHRLAVLPRRNGT